MNFDAFWQTHRRFILGMAGGVVGFFILLALTASGSQDDFKRSSSSIGSTRRKMNASDMYGASSVATLEGRLTSLKERNAELGRMSLPVFRERFQIPTGTPAGQHYISLTGELREDLIGWALRRNCEVDDSLGLPPVSPSQPQQIERILHGLDVVDRVVRLAVENGASEVEKILISQKSRRKGGRNASPLDVTPVTLEIVFQRVSATPFLRQLATEQEGGNPLGLTGLEVLPRNAKRMEQRIILEFGVGVMPMITVGEDLQ
ncbi:MAG: hypothetical protein O3A95_00270 [Planctomycetota bacterium]|nr:hypothetical protein [Planctomycetota bacterium]MDA1112724.1 hypothetical protein [Planctomycetota bacterium]